MKESIYQLVQNDKSVSVFYNKSRELSEQLEILCEKKLYFWIAQMKAYVMQNPSVVSKEWYPPNDAEGSLELCLLGICLYWYCDLFFGKEASDENHALGCMAGTVEYRQLMDMKTWMRDSKEFQEEEIRWSAWFSYFISLGRMEWNELWTAVFEITAWLDAGGKKYFSKYLTGVESTYRFYKEFIWTKQYENLPKDVALVGRNSLFYYLNIVGAQWLNRCYREDYSRTKEKYIFLPGCMTRNPNECTGVTGKLCQAKLCKDGVLCAHCTKDCMVSKVTQKYEKQGVKVRILYHESEMNRRKVKKCGQVGVVGIACLTGLISGGFKARRLGYVPQCVVLNYPGCSGHWCKLGRVATEADCEELEKIVTAEFEWRK